eukprot:6183730-Pleurochrysis_carterae.AAC.2
MCSPLLKPHHCRHHQHDRLHRSHLHPRPCAWPPAESKTFPWSCDSSSTSDRSLRSLPSTHSCPERHLCSPHDSLGSLTALSHAGAERPTRLHARAQLPLPAATRRSVLPAQEALRASSAAPRCCVLTLRVPLATQSAHAAPHASTPQQTAPPHVSRRKGIASPRAALQSYGSAGRDRETLNQLYHLHHAAAHRGFD